MFPLLVGVTGNTERLQEQDWGQHSKNEVSRSVPARKMSLLQRLTINVVWRALGGTAGWAGAWGERKMPNFCNKKADRPAGKASFLLQLSAGGPGGASLRWARQGDLGRRLGGLHVVF